MNVPAIPDKNPPRCCGAACGFVNVGLEAVRGGDWLVERDLEPRFPPKPPPMKLLTNYMRFI